MDFFVAWGLRIEHILWRFLCVFLCPFLGKTSTNSAPEQNSEPQKVYAHDALTNAYIQCEENKMPVRKAAKLYNIPHSTLRERLSVRVHIDNLLLQIETVLFSPILYVVCYCSLLCIRWMENPHMHGLFIYRHWLVFHLYFCIVSRTTFEMVKYLHQYPFLLVVVRIFP